MTLAREIERCEAFVLGQKQHRTGPINVACPCVLVSLELFSDPLGQREGISRVAVGGSWEMQKQTIV